MRVTISQKGMEAVNEGVVALGFYESEGVPVFEGAAAEVDAQSGGALKRAFVDEEFKGARSEVHTFPGWGGVIVMLVGLGKREKADLEAFRVAGGAVMKRADRLKAKRLTTAVHEVELQGASVARRAEVFVGGMVLGRYRFDRFKAKADDEKPRDTVKAVHLLATDAGSARALRKAAEAGQAVAESQVVARDLGNAPGNVATPRWMADQAKRLAKTHGLKCTVLGPVEMKRHKMGGLLGVAQGSDEPPRLVVLEHKPKTVRGQPYKTVALVGKGITFDSGGISLKPGQGMELMKYDKSGACAVIGAMVAVARLDLPVHVIGITAFTENMPSGKAYKPGDIITMANGKTVEILNTDAEGRMILGDALWYAHRYKPDAIVDLATLTGAVDIALGSHYSGLFGSDDALVTRLVQAGNDAGERLWRLPVDDPYQEQIKGHHSDLLNIGGRSAGSCTAARFLRNFVEEDKVAWAHLDIAATAWVESDKPLTPKGCTGVGVRALAAFLRALSDR